MIHYSKILNGIATYIDRELAAQFSGNIKGWLIGAVGGIVAARAGQMMTVLMEHPVLKAMHIVDGEMIDEDLLFSSLVAAAQKGNATVNIPLMGPITFSVKDVEALHRYIIGG